jgi:c-di-GMP-binding flagellar brake protein YcgR
MANREKAIHFRLTEDERRSKYFLRKRQQIIAMLRELARKSTNLSAYYRNGQRFIPTSIVAVIPKQDILTLERAASQLQHDEVLSEGSLFCVSKVDNVQLKFPLADIQESDSWGDTVYVAPFPDGIYRPQRRDFFRVSTPVLKPIVCSLIKHDIGAQKLTTVNISVGGICLIDPNPDHDYRLGELLCEVVLELSGFGTIKTALKVRNITRISRTNGEKAFRIGCCFVDISMGDRTLIQRYLHKLQLEQLSY